MSNLKGIDVICLKFSCKCIFARDQREEPDLMIKVSSRIYVNLETIDN